MILPLLSASTVWNHSTTYPIHWGINIYTVPIISLQVSGLKFDQFPLTRACCISKAVILPLLSVSTVWNHSATYPTHWGINIYTVPIISLQVSGLKFDQFPLTRACCSSKAMILPLLSASTVWNHSTTYPIHWGINIYTVPIISLQVSGLKFDQFPLTRACCISKAVILPLLSVSTVWNHSATYPTHWGINIYTVPIISLQVSGLKFDQFPLTRACCSSKAMILPLLSVSTVWNHSVTYPTHWGFNIYLYLS